MQKWALWHFIVHGAQGPLQAFTALSVPRQPFLPIATTIFAG
jgi:hypothetical protein